MKKIICAALTVLMLFGLVGCVVSITDTQLRLTRQQA